MMKKIFLTTAKNLVLSSALLSVEVFAQSGGVANAVDTANTFRTWLISVVAVVAVALGIGLFIAYSTTDVIRKEHLYKYGIGLIGMTVVGAAVAYAISKLS